VKWLVDEVKVTLMMTSIGPSDWMMKKMTRMKARVVHHWQSECQ
jgi:hypothetical protein